MTGSGRLGVALALGTLAYLPFLALPLISDDYVQIYLGRAYGSIGGWSSLAGDVLYRSRATSLVLTNIVDGMAGLDPTAHRLVNVLLHLVAVTLVAAMGRWNKIGYRVSLPAAMFFAIQEGHQEAVVWSAALPEMLVFVFTLGSLLCWIECRDAAAMALFAIGLYSKESAVVVVPLAAAYWWFERHRDAAGLRWLIAMSGLGLVYAVGIFAAGQRHLHLTDGTFVWSAPFWKVLSVSLFRLLWVWGLLALAILFWHRAERRLVGIAFAWMGITLLPYSFLTYMDRVPSRHTYLASAGLALLAGAAAASLLDRWDSLRHRRLTVALALIVLAGNLGFLWTKKFDQYQRRAEFTERFLQFAAQHDQPIVLRCATYGFEVYKFAVNLKLGSPITRVRMPGEKADGAGAVDYCDPGHP